MKHRKESVKGRHPWGLVVVGLICLGPPGWTGPQTQAQEAQVGESTDQARAQAFFDEAVQDYMAKRYAQAALKFRKAYVHLPEATFLYNQARALAKLESYEQALNALEQAQAQTERPLPEELAQKATPFEAELREKLAQKAAPGLSAPQPTVLPPSEPEAPADDGIRPLTWGAMGLVGLGIVAGAGAIYLGQQASETEEALQPPHAFDRGRYDELAADLESQRLWGQVALYSAVGLGVAGASLWVWSVMGEEDHDTARLHVGPGRIDMRVEF